MFFTTRTLFAMISFTTHALFEAYVFYYAYIVCYNIFHYTHNTCIVIRQEFLLCTHLTKSFFGLYVQWVPQPWSLRTMFTVNPSKPSEQ